MRPAAIFPVTLTTKELSRDYMAINMSKFCWPSRLAHALIPTVAEATRRYKRT